MNRCLILSFLFFSFPACAQPASEPLCQFWLAHKPTAGVAYQPGVDVHGNPVVPADMNAQLPSLPPSRITFPMTIDMARQMNIPVPEGTKMDANMGMIDVYTDGKMLYNGQDISASAQVLCAVKPTKAEATESAPPAEAPKPVQVPVNAPPVSDDKDVIWGEGH